MEFDLRQLVRAVRRWWWIAIAIPVMFGAAALFITSRQQPKYSATATLLVSPGASSGTPDYNSILMAERLSKTYQKLVKNPSVMAKVIADLQLPLSAGQLGDQISASTDADTQLLLIEVVDTDPQRAANIANKTAEKFRDYVVNDLAESTDQDLVVLNDEIQKMAAEIKTSNDQIAALQAQPNANDPAVVDQISGINTKLNEMQGTYGRLLTQASDLRTNSAIASNPVRVAVAAIAPTAPFSPSKPVNLMLGLIAGGIIALSLIVLLEYLDNTVKAATDFSALIGTPLLTTVSAIPKLTQGPHQLFVIEHPKGGAAESIRLLRTNIEFASATKEIAIVGITSASPSEGKSTIAANLAVTLAQAGFVTALVDADLRRPAQHHIFGVNNDRGLSTLLSAPNRPWDGAAQPTMLPNLTLIPSGPLPPNPADLLSLERLPELLTDMRGTFDVIVLDTPPVLAVSDPLIIAANTDGMILVSRSGKTRMDALKRATATLQRSAVRIVGVIVNQQTGRSIEGYYFAEYQPVDENPKSSGRIPRHETAPSLPSAESHPAN